MENKTKEEAKKKLKYMKYKIGYPQTIEKFDNFKLKNNFSKNLIELNIFLFNKNINKFNLDIPVDKEEWSMGAFEVNAYYNSQFNELVIPAGILQAPFFDLKQSLIKNYAGIGVVIGHEIFHSLDELGRKFDYRGIKKDWWTSGDATRYELMAQKLIDQYNNYELYGKKLNGKFTFGENFADYLGFTLAYITCNVMNDNDKIKFFSHFAFVDRELKTKEKTITQLYSDPHSPHIFRVNGVLSLIDDFYKIYKEKLLN